MAIALICSQTQLDAELGQTALWRGDMERRIVTRPEEARVMAIAAKPNIVVVDRDLPGAARLVTELRQEPSTRALSIAVLARGDFEPSEVLLLEAGANAVLRLPPGRDWNERLVRLIHVPMRKAARFPVQFAVEAVHVEEGTSIPAMALNLSETGILIDSQVPIRVGDALSLVFRLPSSASPVMASGRVVRQASASQFGIEFSRLESGALERIRTFVREAPGS